VISDAIGLGAFTAKFAAAAAAPSVITLFGSLVIINISFVIPQYGV
jgi:hypothetical protein